MPHDQATPIPWNHIDRHNNSATRHIKKSRCCTIDRDKLYFLKSASASFIASAMASSCTAILQSSDLSRAIPLPFHLTLIFPAPGVSTQPLNRS
nr:MAG TPA: hypothetical protein [Caudoviricetes sp.]